MSDKGLIELKYFKSWTLENFPFIEDDFNAITDYQLMCKLKEYVVSIGNDVANLEIDYNELAGKIVELEEIVNNMDGEFDDLVEEFNSLKTLVESYNMRIIANANRIEQVNTNLQQLISLNINELKDYVDDQDTLILADISTINENIVLIRKDIEVIAEAIPKVRDTGTVITLNDTIKDAHIDIKLDPSELSQETTTGANLQKFNARESATYGYSCDDKGQVTITGTSNPAGLGYNLQNANPITLEPGNYILKVIGTIGSNISIQTMGVSRLLDNNQEYHFTVSETITNFYSGCYLNQGEHNANYYMTLSKDTATTERYTGGIPAPNPTYPSDIHVISGDNTIKVCGKNLFSGNYSQFTSTGGEGTTYGYFKLPDTTNTYTISLIAKNNFTPTMSQYIGFTKYGGQATGGFSWLISGGVAFTKGQKKSITNYSGQTRLDYVSLYSNNASTLETLLENFDIQLEIGTTATTYEPYQSQTYELTLGDIKLRKIGTYEDYFTKNSGKNLFDKANTNILNASMSVVSGGTYMMSQSANAKSLYIPCEPNTTYTMSKVLSARCWMGTSSDTPTTSSTLLNGTYNNSATSLTLTTPSNGHYLVVYYFLNGTDTLSEQTILDSIQIEKCSTATTYEPYGTGLWCKYNAIGEVVFNGTESWIAETSGGYATNPYFRTGNTTFITTYQNIKSNYFIGTNISSSTSNGIQKSANLILLQPSNGILTASDFKTWLGTHNTKAVAPLITPYLSLVESNTLINQLNNIENAMLSYQGQTSITQQNNDLPFNMSVTALLDLNTIIND